MPKILVVDDDLDYVSQLQTGLENMGAEVIAASGMVEADIFCKLNRPDLAIVDVMLEQADGGFTLCHKLKKKDPSIPIILVSAVSIRHGMTFNVSTQEERSWIKADVFLDKPVPFETIRKEVKRLLIMQ
jgi:CheY-like chemotaxis protein